MKEVIKNVEKMYLLVEDDMGNYVLNTVCGGIGMYEVSIRLDAHEAERFREEGCTFIESLAYELGCNTDRFKDRILK